ncbi:hypothetical protein [Deinococcus hopiensis]|uniref:hypothetical protein n=1 Tax=Deinococcus hopiensis TaxID=309885 RepID=UPI00111C8FBD|nr:hypothetical protein [Deinococcus hopiensis]
MPRQHRERLAERLEDGHLHLQRVVHRVARALNRAAPTKRACVLPLPSNAGNSHLHGHAVSLPPARLAGSSSFISGYRVRLPVDP